MKGTAAGPTNGRLRLAFAGRAPRWLLLLLLSVHAALLAYSAAIHSPVGDEPAHLAAGISHWRFGDFSLYRVNPPVVRMVAAAPLLATSIRTDWHNYVRDPKQRSEFTVGDDLIEANGHRIFWYVTLARWACIPFSLVGALVCYRWARLLFGQQAGLAAAALWCVSPMMLGHGSLITPDVGGAAFGVAACYALHRWLLAPSARHTVLAGLLLGGALVCKSTWIILFGAFPCIWLLYRAIFRRRAPRPTAWQLAAILALGWAILVSLYGWQGVGVPLKTLPLSSHLFQSIFCDPHVGNGSQIRAPLANVPLPLPRDYFLGLDQQYVDLEGPQRSFLRGEWRREGWHHYYVYGLAVKEPLGALVLAGLSLAWWCGAIGDARIRKGVSARRLRVVASGGLLLLCPLAVLVLASMNTGMNHHVRYVMPVLPFLYILAAGLMTRAGAWPRWRRGATIVLVAFAALSSAWNYPHSMSYFNEAAGGSRGGIYHLNNSNIDWGQDLLLLKDWQQRHSPEEPIHLAYFGRMPPSHAGIVYQLPPLLPAGYSEQQRAEVAKGLAPGWYAVSVTLLQGRGYYVFSPDNRRITADENAFAYFQGLKPVDRVGHSIFIYRVGD